jgi:hypothetical protein
MRGYQIENCERIVYVGTIPITLRSARLTLKGEGGAWNDIADISLETASKLAALWLASEPKPIEVSCVDDPGQVEPAQSQPFATFP